MLPRELLDHNPLILILDHNPLILTTQNNVPLTKLSFKFELAWLKNPDFIPTVKRLWERPCYA